MSPETITTWEFWPHGRTHPSISLRGERSMRLSPWGCMLLWPLLVFPLLPVSWPPWCELLSSSHCLSTMKGWSFWNQEPTKPFLPYVVSVRSLVTAMIGVTDTHSRPPKTHSSPFSFFNSTKFRWVSEFLSIKLKESLVWFSWFSDRQMNTGQFFIKHLRVLKRCSSWTSAHLYNPIYNLYMDTRVCFCISSVA